MVLIAEQSDLPTACPRVLVLLATYNGAPWLIEQVESILAQQNVDVSILIGDDLSKDETRSLISETWGHDPRVRFHKWEQGSGSAGANFRRLYRFADSSEFDLVALADQDDIWAVDKLELAAIAMKSSGASGYSCSVNSFWPDGRERIMAQRASVTDGDFLFEGAGQGCTFVINAALFRQVRTFCNEHSALVEALHYHDWLIYLLSRAWGRSWYFDPIPHMRYRQHDGNEIGSRGGAGALSRRIALIRNGWYRKQVQAAAEIYVVANTRYTKVNRFLAILNGRDSILRRLGVGWFCLISGRRRKSDRAVLVFAAASGWL